MHLEVVEGVGGRGGARELGDALGERGGADVHHADDVALRALESCDARSLISGFGCCADADTAGLTSSVAC